MASKNYLISGAITLIAWFLVVSRICADPLPLRDFANASFTPSDFVFRNLFSQKNANLKSAGGSQHPANVHTFPALSTLSSSATLLRINPCGINSPHTHPRGTEHQYLFQGTLAIGLVDTRNNYFANIVHAGDTFVFPKGLLHFEQNVGEDEVISLAFFNSQLAGTIAADEAYRKVPQTVLASTFGVSDAGLIADVFHPGSLVVGQDKECLKALKNGTLANYAQLLLEGRKLP